MGEGFYFKKQPEHRLEDIVGHASVVDRLSSIVLGARCEYTKNVLRMPSLQTYLFYGLPGCGRRFLIEAFAAELMDYGYRYVAIEASQLVSRIVGETEKKIFHLFEEVRRTGKCILFIDDIELLCWKRSTEKKIPYMDSRTVAFLLAHDTLRDSDGEFIVIGSTSYPESVDPALTDKSQLLLVELPDLEVCSHRLEVELSDKLTLEDGLTYKEMAECAQGCNYYELNRLSTALKEKMFIEVRRQFGDDEAAAMEALQNGSIRLTRKIMEEVFERYKPRSKEYELEAMRRWREEMETVL